MNPPSAHSSRRFVVILNRESGTIKEQWHDELPEELAAAFRKGGADAEVHAVTPDEIERAIKSGLDSQPDALIVGGGDGTVSRSAGQVAASGIPLGILPYGTFNLAARDLNIPLDPIEAATALARASVKPIDLLDISGRSCLCNCMLGFYPAMAEKEAEYHGQAWWVKSFRILGSLKEAFQECPPLSLTLHTNESENLVRITRFAVFVPGDYEDIFSVIPKRIDLTGGKISVYLSKHRRVATLARAMLAYVFGFLKKEPRMERIQTAGLSLTSRREHEVPASIDGEILRLKLPLELTIKPNALQVLSPAGDSIEE